MSDEKGAICQSCGMPLEINNADTRGTNSDGSRNEEYCHFCFVDGAFKEPDLILDQQIEKLTKMGVEKLVMPEEEARAWATGVLPNLKRWRTNS
jgi:hypothetical protein